MSYRSNKNILVCSNDSQIVGILRQSLANYTLVVVERASDARDALTHFNPGLILTDMFLPDADIFDFLIQMQRTPDSRPKIVVLANQVSSLLAEQLKSLYISGVIKKTADPDALWTELQVYLDEPVSPEPSKASSFVPRDSGNCRGTVLVVEDSEECAQAVEILLGLNGFEVTIAESAERAMHLLPKNPYNLMLLDLRLPGMDGVELLARIRHSGIRIPCIVVTASDDPEDRKLLDELGVEAVFSKPADYNRISQLVGSLVETA